VHDDTIVAVTILGGLATTNKPALFSTSIPFGMKVVHDHIQRFKRWKQAESALLDNPLHKSKMAATIGGILTYVTISRAASHRTESCNMNFIKPEYVVLTFSYVVVDISCAVTMVMPKQSCT
jgi:hypothetical protein